jgi:hypothetical protein
MRDMFDHAGQVIHGLCESPISTSVRTRLLLRGRRIIIGARRVQLYATGRHYLQNRLIYCPAKNAHGNGTHEWRFVQSLEQANKITRQARDNIDQTNIMIRRRRRTEQAKVH